MKTTAAIFLICMISIQLQGQCLHHSTAGFASPVTANVPHVHPKGSMMASLRSDFMQMQGMQAGNRQLNNETVFHDYPMYADKMEMNMQMLMLMYGITDRINLMVMTHYMNCRMDMQMKMGSIIHPMNSSASGFGDTRLTLVFNPLKKNTNFLLAAGVQLPSGAIDNRMPIMQNPHAKLGYAMQFGSGTVDLALNAVYSVTKPQWNYGLQAELIKRNSYNRNNYRLGNQMQVNAWVSRLIGSGLCAGIHLQSVITNPIQGQDAEIEVDKSALNDPANSGARILCSNAYVAWQPSKKAPFTAALSFGVPLLETYRGIQMNTRSQTSLKLSYSISPGNHNSRQ